MIPPGSGSVASDWNGHSFIQLEAQQVGRSPHGDPSALGVSLLFLEPSQQGANSRNGAQIGFSFLFKGRSLWLEPLSNCLDASVKF